MKRILTVASVAALLAASHAPIPAAAATTVTFGFEAEVATYPPGQPPGALASLTMTSDELSVTITRSSGALFDVVDNNGRRHRGKPVAWGARSLSPFSSLPAVDTWVADFSYPLSAFSIDFGDKRLFGVDRPVEVFAYSGPGATGALLASAATTWTGSDAFPDFKTLTVASTTPIASVTFTSNGPSTNSLYWDNMVASVASLNTAPDCSATVASVEEIWPPNHGFVDVDVLGVTDADGDPITITVDSIHQDEPTDGVGEGKFTPDGQGVGTPTAQVRAERSGTREMLGNGRVYHVGYTADDGLGGSCSGVVTVGVPHDRHGAAVDEGPLYDSTA